MLILRFTQVRTSYTIKNTALLSSKRFLWHVYHQYKHLINLKSLQVCMYFINKLSITYLLTWFANLQLTKGSMTTSKFYSMQFRIKINSGIPKFKGELGELEFFFRKIHLHQQKFLVVSVFSNSPWLTRNFKNGPKWSY